MRSFKVEFNITPIIGRNLDGQETPGYRGCRARLLLLRGRSTRGGSARP
jgi:hypothetical protein